jgi:hypothetical protein
MALNKDLWSLIVEEKMWPNNEFYDFSVDHTGMGAVFANKVHVPNAGTFATSVIVNNTNWPLSAEQRTDDDLTYNANTFHSSPKYVNLVELYEYTYPKVLSLVTQMTNELKDKVGQYAIYNWSVGLTTGSTTQIGGLVASTGTARPAGLPYQTGNRLATKYEDFVAAHQKLNAQNVSLTDRGMLVSSQGLSDLQNLGKYQYAFIQLGRIIEDGTIGTFLGAKVFMRGTFGVNFTTNPTGATSLTGIFEFTTSATTAATANDFCLIWQKDKVAQWKGSMSNGGIELFEQPRNPFYQADVISATIRHGSTRIRKDNYGVVAIVETQV